MSSNRYGRIYHDGHLYNDLKFESTAERDAFEEKFDAYHASHEHDGEVPRFEGINRADIKKETYNIPHVSECTIDGYRAHEIYEYHNRDDDRYVHYHPPTTCVHPIIVLKQGGGAENFTDSGSLERHELSGVFRDMTGEEFENLQRSIERDGIVDPIIRIYEEKVLDGWHRYRACRELNILRKLRFKLWGEITEGDPVAFVSARNLERRHYSAGQRGQIVVELNKWLERGDADSQRDDAPSGASQPKSKVELAAEANVGLGTIDRAKAVSRAGRADEVISGEKSAGEVLKEEKEKALEASREKMEASEKRMWQALWEIKEKVHAQNFITAACAAHPNWGVDNFPKDAYATDIPDIWEGRYNLIHTQIQIGSKWVSAFIESPHAEPGSPRLEIESKQEGSEEDSLTPPETSKSLKAMVEFNLKAWQNINPIKFKPVILSDLLNAWRYCYGDREREGEDANTVELEGILESMREEYKPFMMQVDHISSTRCQQIAEVKEGNLAGEIRDYIPKWINANPVRAEDFAEHADKITLKLLLNARSEIEHGIERGDSPFFREEMEDLLEKLKTGDAALVGKVREMLWVSTKSSETGKSCPTAIAREKLESLVDTHKEKTVGIIQMEAWQSALKMGETEIKSLLDEIYQERFGRKAYPGDLVTSEAKLDTEVSVIEPFDDETDDDEFLIEGIDLHFRRENSEGNRVSNAGIESLSFSGDDHTGLYSGEDIGDLPDEVIRGIENFLKSYFKEQNKG